MHRQVAEPREQGLPAPSAGPDALAVEPGRAQDVSQLGDRPAIVEPSGPPDTGVRALIFRKSLLSAERIEE